MFIELGAMARFSDDAMRKADVIRGDHMFVGLNCLRAGQSQRVHSHAGADKFYLVLSGRVTIRIADDVRTADAGTLAWAPAGVPHGIERAEEDAVVVVGMAPGP